jgi:hypothetical protein
MNRVPFIAAVAAVAAALPAGAGAGTATFKGVVVGQLRGAVLVAPASGLVRAFSGHESVGSRVEFAGGRLVVVGRSHTALVRGIVVRRIGTTMFLSSNKHLVAIHTGRRLASASDTPPAPSTPPTPSTPTTPTTGDDVAEQVTVGSNGQLDEQNADDLGPSNDGSVQVQAVVASVGTGTVTLTVNGQTLVVPLPAGLTLPSSFVGQTVTLNLSLNGQNDQGDDDSGDNGSGDNGSGYNGGGSGGD